MQDCTHLSRFALVSRFFPDRYISPVDSYTIIYNYDAYQDDYYFVRSSPECWYSKESNHSVIFREVSSNEQNTEFAVEMHQYVTLNVTNSCRSWNADIPFIGDSICTEVPQTDRVWKDQGRRGKDFTGTEREKRGGDHRSGMLPGSYSHVSSNPTPYECVRVYGIPEKQEQPDDL